MTKAPIHSKQVPRQVKPLPALPSVCGFPGWYLVCHEGLEPDYQKRLSITHDL